MLAAYDAIADWYDRFVRDGVFLSADQVISASGLEADRTLQGRKICDLACGQGHVARQLAARGAAVTGVNISQSLLDLAVKEEGRQPLGIVYLNGDAQDLPALPGEPFDCVFCNLALMDIENLEAVLAGVTRILRPGGEFIVSVTHPCFQYPRGQDYVTESFWRSDNPHGVRGRVGAYHRMLGTYITAFGSAGLLLDRAVEVQLNGYELPPVIVMRCKFSFHNC